ncbi:CHAT domain-containing protein [Microcoleus anatoxicus]|uniref:CHAT domain-containing protein n=1 Tax=Microcoleus anatoxicus TaxID=2705319 RepID=UPI00297AC546|nr:MAG: CHAT domain-containing protein [Oscillatoriales cyanobacterium]
MGKLVILTLEKEDFQQGFPARLQIGLEGEPLSAPINGYLPPNPKIPNYYKSWQSEYLTRIRNKSRLDKSKPFKSNVSNGEVNAQAENLTITMNQWFNSQEFSLIREELVLSLKPDDEVRFIIQAPSIQLRQLPWHLWDLLKDYPLAEIALSAPNYGQVSPAKKSRNKVRILAILGDSEGINTEKDRELLEQLPGVETVVLPQPNRKQINHHLFKHSWDILFFAGHSKTEGESGRIYINETDNLTINELKEPLEKAINKGLKLAIFNSCDGLGLAQELADLQIPQIIVMREPVPDDVAQAFLKYFLNAFASGKSLYLSVNEARQKLQYLDEHPPSVSWLPVICQNPSQLMPTWDKLRAVSGAKTISTKTRNHLLAKVKDEVESRRAQSLHNRVVIQQPKELQPKQVETPWGVEVRLNHLPNQLLSPETKLVDVFQQSNIDSKLLIIGDPGNGKTITLLELAKQLITQAEDDTNRAIPVLLNLSSWKDEKQPLLQWLIAELVSKYDVSLNIAEELLENHRILPLLDGLDETLWQESCVEAINQFLESAYRPPGLVVCSRKEGYEFINAKLKLNGAICLQPVAKAEVQKYFADMKCLQLWQTIKNSDAFLKLLESPLMLNLMVLVGQEMLLEDEVTFKSTQELEESLLDVYIQQMLKQKIKNVSYSQQTAPSAKKTQKWLAFLANKYQDKSQTEFSGFSLEQMQPHWLEQMQPHWLPCGYKQIYALGVGLIFGLSLAVIVGSIVWLTVGILFEPFWGAVIILALALFVMLISSLWAFLTVGQAETIEPVETLIFSYKKLLKSLIGGLIAGLITWKLSGMMVFLSVGLVIALIYGVSGSNIEKIKIPNQSIWQSVKNASLFALIGATSMAIPAAMMSKQLLAMIVESSVLQNKIGMANIVLSAIIVGTLFGFTQAGMAGIQHFTLRLILWCNGYIPWNYARFLDYATERKFLQRVGGRYQFIHKLLQVRLAGK